MNPGGVFLFVLISSWLRVFFVLLFELAVWKAKCKDICRRPTTDWGNHGIKKKETKAFSQTWVSRLSITFFVSPGNMSPVLLAARLPIWLCVFAGCFWLCITTLDLVVLRAFAVFFCLFVVCQCAAHVLSNWQFCLFVRVSFSCSALSALGHRGEKKQCKCTTMDTLMLVAACATNPSCCLVVCNEDPPERQNRHGPQ